MIVNAAPARRAVLYREFIKRMYRNIERKKQAVRHMGGFFYAQGCVRKLVALLHDSAREQGKMALPYSIERRP